MTGSTAFRVRLKKSNAHSIETVNLADYQPYIEDVLEKAGALGNFVFSNGPILRGDSEKQGIRLCSSNPNTITFSIQPEGLGNGACWPFTAHVPEQPGGCDSFMTKVAEVIDAANSELGSNRLKPLMQLFRELNGKPFLPAELSRKRMKRIGLKTQSQLGSLVQAVSSAGVAVEFCSETGEYTWRPEFIERYCSTSKEKGEAPMEQNPVLASEVAAPPALEETPPESPEEQQTEAPARKLKSRRPHVDSLIYCFYRLAGESFTVKELLPLADELGYTNPDAVHGVAKYGLDKGFLQIMNPEAQRNRRFAWTQKFLERLRELLGVDFVKSAHLDAHVETALKLVREKAKPGEAIDNHLPLSVDELLDFLRQAWATLQIALNLVAGKHFWCLTDIGLPQETKSESEKLPEVPILTLANNGSQMESVNARLFSLRAEKMDLTIHLEKVQESIQNLEDLARTLEAERDELLAAEAAKLPPEMLDFLSRHPEVLSKKQG